MASSSLFPGNQTGLPASCKSGQRGTGLCQKTYAARLCSVKIRAFLTFGADLITSLDQLLHATGITGLTAAQRATLDNGIQDLVVLAIKNLDDAARAAVANASDEELRGLVSQSTRARVRINDEITAKRAEDPNP